MATIQYFDSFISEALQGTHQDALDGGTTDELYLYLSNTTPVAGTHTVRAAAGAGGGALEDLATGNGYTAGGKDMTNVSTDVTGTVTVTGTDVTWTASGGTIPDFRYLNLYNKTQGEKLIGWWDYGSVVSLTVGKQFSTTLGSNMFRLVTP